MKSFDYDVTGQRFDDLITGKLTFLVVAKVNFYEGKVGDMLNLRELSYKIGPHPLKHTGRSVYALVTHVVNDFTMKGLHFDFLGLSLHVAEEARTPLPTLENMEGGDHA